VARNGRIVHSFHGFGGVSEVGGGGLCDVCQSRYMLIDAIEIGMHGTDSCVLNTIVTIENHAIHFGKKLIDLAQSIAMIRIVHVHFLRIVSTRQSITRITRFAFTFVDGRSGHSTFGIDRARERWDFAIINLLTLHTISCKSLSTQTRRATRAGFGTVGISVARILCAAQIDLLTFAFGTITRIPIETFADVFSRTNRFAFGLRVTRPGFAVVNGQTCDTITVVTANTFALMSAGPSLFARGEWAARNFGRFAVVDFDGGLCISRKGIALVRCAFVIARTGNLTGCMGRTWVAHTIVVSHARQLTIAVVPGSAFACVLARCRFGANGILVARIWCFGAWIGFGTPQTITFVVAFTCAQERAGSCKSTGGVRRAGFVVRTTINFITFDAVTTVAKFAFAFVFARSRGFADSIFSTR